MAGVDGSIVIDTAVDDKGVKVGFRDLEASARRMATSVEGIGNKAKIALQKQVDAFSKLNAQYEQQKKKVDELNRKKQEYASQKIPTEEYREIQNQIDGASVKLNNLINKQQKFLDMGGSTRSNAYKSMQYDIDELTNSIRYAKGELADLEQSGKAFTLGSNTEAAKRDMEKLAVEQEKLSDISNRLKTSYASIEEKVESYRKKLIQTDTATRKADKSTRQFGSSLKSTGKNARGAHAGLGRMLATSVLFSFVFRAISAVTSGIAKGMSNLAQYSNGTNASISMLMSSLLRLKNAFATAFAPIFSVVAPILSRFIDMLSSAATYVSMFFSILSGKGTYTRAVAVQQDYAASLKDTAGAAQDAADSTKAAQKATTQYLSGLDEVRRFETPSSASGSMGNGAGGTASGGVSPSEMFEEVPIDNKFAEYIAKMLKVLEPTTEALKKLWNEGLSKLGDFAWDSLKGFYHNFLVPVGTWALGEGIPRLVNALNNGLMKVDFDRITASLNRLWQVLAPFAIRVGDGLVWFWENALVPLGTWVANEVVPRFLDTLRISIGLLNEILTALQPLFQWFWDNVLQPLAAWTGGIFLQVWEGINTALQSFSSWCAENPGVIQAMTAIVVSFLAAWKLAPIVMKIASFVQAGFNIISMTKSVSGALALLKHGLSVLTGGFNPVVLAIGAVIAAGVLLWQNWDEIRAKASEIFGKLKTIAKDVFGYLQEKIFAPFITWLTSIFQKDWTESFGAFGKVLNGFFKSVEEIWGDIKEIFNGIVTFITGVFSGDWKKALNGLVKIFTGVFEGIGDIAKLPINGIITAFNAVISIINGLISKVNSISFKITVPDWIPGIGGSWWGFGGFNIPTIGTIPYLASGAVIPPRSEFLAVLGDQKNGRNLEAPEGLLRQIVREESGGSGGGTYRFIAQINRRTLLDEMITEAKMRQMTSGNNPFELA